MVGFGFCRNRDFVIDRLRPAEDGVGRAFNAAMVNSARRRIFTICFRGLAVLVEPARLIA